MTSGSRAEGLDARARAMREYYDRRAPEYDQTSFEAEDHPFRHEVKELIAAVSALEHCRTLDVGCGTGYLTEHLRGEITGIDQSRSMLAIARKRLPQATLIEAEIPPLPFDDDSFDRVFTSNVYSHLHSAELRSQFVQESLRVAPELIVVDEARRQEMPKEHWHERPLLDDSTWSVFKKYYTADELAAELKGMVLLVNSLFVMVRASR